MPERTDLVKRIAKHYDLPLQASKFLSLLVLSEMMTAEVTYQQMGAVDARGVVFKLRKQLPKEIEIKSRRAVGYWLDDATRRDLARKFNVDLGISI